MINVNVYRAMWCGVGVTVSGSLLSLITCLSAVGAYELYPTATTPENSNSTALPFYHPLGRLNDATCNVEEIEHANEGQLYCILQQLSNTSFFRNFVVDLDHGCPLTKKENNVNAITITDKDSKETSDDAAETTKLTKNSRPTTLPFISSQGPSPSGTCSGNLPEFIPEENEGKQACDIEFDVPSPKESSLLLSAMKEGEEVKSAVPSTGAETASLDDFECTTSQEEEDEPLCEIKEDEGILYSRTPLKGFFSSALKAIWDAVGWESEAQKETFTWSAPSDVIEGVVSMPNEPCDVDFDASFWMDMCSQIKAGEGTRIVNLVSNPERNTGYNGTHIWKAIYYENCMALDGNTTGPMCYEERVLYRLLSGMHASTSISIAKYYFPPSARKGRLNWEPNPKYFMEKFGNHPEYIRNLYFSYVVMLRALKKAKSFLYNYEISTGDIVDDETASVLLKRLLDSDILSSCTNIFSAFDESLMFKESSVLVEKKHGVTLQQNFKGVFHNISSILDCVRCEKCKLHGKMTMLGYGAALKILLLPESAISTSSVSRNEIVAFVNTIIKFSESIKDIRELTHHYWESVKALPYQPSSAIASSPSLSVLARADNTDTANPVFTMDVATEDKLVDTAIGAISALCRSKNISDEREAELVTLALHKDPGTLTIAKYYANDLKKFLIHSINLAGPVNKKGRVTEVASDEKAVPDAIVVGSGLAGLTATLNILDRGGTVTLIEKEHTIGGNSAKASSGINACCPLGELNGDNLLSFTSDTVKSAGKSAQLSLIETLTGNSAKAVEWLQNRVHVDLSVLAQLGGHSHKRTHRPSEGMVGAELIFGLQREIKKYEKSGKVRILLDTQVSKLTYDGERVVGVDIRSSFGAENNTKGTLPAANVILATGGFASDRSSGSYLDQYRPELMKMPATAGDFSTGDGIRLAMELGAGTVDMDKIQLHPTGWVDDSDPQNPTKILAAELIRGVGGLLLNKHGKRFCNELGTRAYVTEKMLDHDPIYNQTKKWDKTVESPVFTLVLSSSAAEEGEKHVRFYTHKGLMHVFHGIHALADWMGVDVRVVKETITRYREDAAAGIDVWGKTTFRGVPSENLENEVFYAGKVTPVLHYCMGGITIDTEGHVIQKNGTLVQGLYAAGEVSGGVHGDNRLAGNSLLECTVFGMIVGRSIPLQEENKVVQISEKVSEKQSSDLRGTEISAKELALHNSPEDCWVAIHGSVYDLTNFAEEHPPGAKSIWDVAGKDGTEPFQAVHSKNILEDFQDVLKGVYVP